MEMQDFYTSQTRSPHRHRVKFVRPGTRTVLKPGIGLAVSFRAHERPTGPLVGLGARPVDLKFASLNTKARLNIGVVFCYHILVYHPRSSRGLWNLFLVIIVDYSRILIYTRKNFGVPGV